jgi:hypothetical protein
MRHFYQRAGNLGDHGQSICHGNDHQGFGLLQERQKNKSETVTAGRLGDVLHMLKQNLRSHF